MSAPAEKPFGETWVYESIVGALPGVDISDGAAVAIQFVLFEVAVLAVGLGYGLYRAALAGTVAVLVAAIGSAFMLDLGRRTRALSLPDPYRRLLFGSSVEVVLGVLAYVALLTYLFVYDPRAGTPLVTALLGESPPLPAAFLLLLVLWDVCYRIGTGWWAAVVALWRSFRFALDPETARALGAIDRRNVGFAVLQLVLVPFLDGHPVLVVAVVGHVVAVLVVAGAAYALLPRS